MSSKVETKNIHLKKYQRALKQWGIDTFLMKEIN